MASMVTRTMPLPHLPRLPDVPGGLITVQPLKQSEMQPSYAQDLGVGEIEHGVYGSLMNGLGSLVGTFGQIPCCICCPNPFREVNQGQVGLVSRFGKFYKAVDPGLVKVNPFSEELKKVDVKIQVSQIPTQTVMTKDGVSVQVDSVVYWHVNNPYRAVFGISDVRSALIERAQTTLRDVIGSRALQSVVSDREGVAIHVEDILERVAKQWGISIESLLLKDIIFSRELQESLSSAATQTRIGQSKVIAARAEVDSAKLMRQAADILASPAAMAIRELDALQVMAKSAGTKVLFVPMSLSGGRGAPPTALQSAVEGGGQSYNTTGGEGSSTMNAATLQQMANM
ncbi:hypothetical protein BCV69DRAFT_288353 [Microstroma glucosiphilum]|uniref:Band 7 domain-containing protein n=1 Tax=Pseudomicrostroma glucosiphilum TaxID=1684307 RepID=A0A316TZN4_9BASI|nr:hypothetical protein BCV69DRAFT_288353 [Pseudomicrostroma glucosiphilum]PWN18557.1 hypothetical protein BCV69DRAFT_288353 [Pseudomicrostroma glucosiphilum]